MRTNKIITTFLFILLTLTCYPQKIVYSTFLGGSKEDGYSSWLKNFTVDEEGTIYFAMCTNSTNFPVTDDAYDKTYNRGNADWGDEDLVLVQFNTVQNKLKYASYFGGSNGPEFVSQVLFKDNNMFLVGNTGSSNFPVSNNAFDKTFNGPVFRHADGFLSRFNATNFSYSTYIGTSGNDGIAKILFNAKGEMLVLATLENWNEFPVTNQYSTEKIGINNNEKQAVGNACILRFNANGDTLLSTTVLFPTWGVDFTLDNEGYIYVAGATLSKNIQATPNAYDTSYNGGSNSCVGGDIFVTKLSPSCDKIIFSTYIGGTNDEIGPKICIDNSKNIIISGITYSSDFPLTNNAFDKTFDGTYEPFFVKLSNDGKQIKYSSLFGKIEKSDKPESIINIYETKNGEFLMCGYTSAVDFPVTTNAMFSKNAGGEDITISIFDSTFATMKYSSYIGGTGDDRGTMELDNDGNIVLVGSTTNSSFPVTNGCYDASYNGGEFDLFIMKLDMGATTEQHSPVLSSSIRDTSILVNKYFNWYMPSNTFNDEDLFEVLTYSVTLADGSALPAWLKTSYNITTGLRFYGTPKEEWSLKIKVTVSDKNNLTATDEFQIIVKSILGLDIEKRAQVNVYPNPTSGLFTIFFGTNPSQQANVEIFNLQGNTVFSKTYQDTTTETINLTGFRKGIYQVNISVGKDIFNKKICLK